MSAWKLIAAAWLLLYAVSGAHQYLPTSYWMVVPENGVVVHDTEAGSCPAMEVTRRILRPFHAQWIVTLRKKDHRGAFVHAGSWSQQDEYNTSNVLPDPVDFGWWAYIDDCSFMEAGTYTVTTKWVLFPGSAARARTIRVVSNEFQILP